MVKIEFIPKLPDIIASSTSAGPHFEDAHNQCLYDVLFHLNGGVIKYHPAELQTILVDLEIEREFLEKKSDHVMSLSGYDVSQVYYLDGSWVFKEVFPRAPGEERKLIADNISHSEILSRIVFAEARIKSILS